MRRGTGQRTLYAILGGLLVVSPVVAQSIPPAGAQSCALKVRAVDSSEAAKWREDLRYMAVEMPKHHFNLFHTMTRTQFENAVKKLDEQIPGLARHQILVEMMRIVALVSDGHTSLNPKFNPAMGFRSYPFKLYLYKDGLYIQAADRKYAAAVGARVLKIGNVSAEQAFKTVSDVVARDNEMTLKQRVPQFLVIPEVLHALGLIDDMERAGFVVEKNGRQTTIEFTPVGSLAQTEHGQKDEQDSDPSRNWVRANVGAQAPVPLWLKAPHDNYWFEYLADSSTVYVQYNEVMNKKDESIAAFARRVFEFVDTHPVDRFVLDVRLNEGGDAFYNKPILLGMIKSEKINRRGHLFTIIGRGTFSATQILVNELERYTNTIFVGEPTGGSVSSYGDHEFISLPNSGITVATAPTWYLLGMNTRDQRPWVAPQIVTELTSEDYRTNNDPALNVILNYKSMAEVLMPALQANDMSLAVKLYRDFRSNPRTSAINTESDMNFLGYRLLGINHVDQAIEIFKLNVEAYPHSPNAYDSLGDAYSQSGNKELAIKNYEKALELHIRNPQTAEKLKRLRNQ